MTCSGHGVRTRTVRDQGWGGGICSLLIVLCTKYLIFFFFTNYPLSYFLMYNNHTPTRDFKEYLYVFCDYLRACVMCLQYTIIIFDLG